MKPTLEEYRTGCTTWNFSYKGTRYKVAHHGVSDYNREGTWCFYVFFNSKMFQSKDDWALFDVKPVIKPYSGDKFWEHVPYDDIPEFNWHGGATFAKIHQVLDKFTGEYYPVLEVGCDYAHLWDEERGYPDTLESVKCDAFRVIDELHMRYPQNEICAYSGMIDHPSQFYTAKNGVMVHKSMEEKIRENKWENWLP